MNVQSRNKGDSKRDKDTQISSVKRPFDVAFLMLPDEKVNNDASKVAKSEKTAAVYYEDDEDEEIDIENSTCEYKNVSQKLYTQKQQIFDDPALIKSKKVDPLRGKLSSYDQKSAFTKVNLPKEASLSPNLSLSPDVNYQHSLSPSPPIINRTYPNFASNILPPGQIFKTSYQMPENIPAHSGVLESHFLGKSTEFFQPNFHKLRSVMYRPELPYGYQFPNQEILNVVSPTEVKFPNEMRSPTSAMLTSLLPPSLAALSVPAQNVCAKCNITFRMTSDLVYHMRSHHKNEAGDPNKRRREEKLKCPVCAESFRERHHLTRHMTAHQDKDEDDKGVIKNCA
ncbi:uncharacterized protein LOC132697131 [Cylas formicarius]|uniref:uncharacterized protein LOC132697131 n=1 Tax=Cylas formicarius TaxID=197179 RepID=UPI002958712B|nr:uncharacterized protein LOC132697131 [Cylas formicarius]